jgi:hypothetical protein
MKQPLRRFTPYWKGPEKRQMTNSGLREIHLVSWWHIMETRTIIWPLAHDIRNVVNSKISEHTLSISMTMISMIKEQFVCY